MLVDGAQGAGAIPVAVEELGADFYTVSAQKWLLGPASTGALYVAASRLEECRVAFPSYFSWKLPDYELRDDATRFEGSWTPPASIARPARIARLRGRGRGGALRAGARGRRPLPGSARRARARGRHGARPGDARLLAGGGDRRRSSSGWRSRASSFATCRGSGSCAPPAASGRATTTSNGSFGGFSSAQSRPKRVRMPRSLRGLILAGALVLAGCGVGGEKARDAVEEPEVTKAQLAAMVLPQAELGRDRRGPEAGRRLRRGRKRRGRRRDRSIPRTPASRSAPTGASAATGSPSATRASARSARRRGRLRRAPWSSCWRTRSTPRSTFTSSSAMRSATPEQAAGRARSSARVIDLRGRRRRRRGRRPARHGLLRRQEAARDRRRLPARPLHRRRRARSAADKEDAQNEARAARDQARQADPGRSRRPDRRRARRRPETPRRGRRPSRARRSCPNLTMAQRTSAHGLEPVAEGGDGRRRLRRLPPELRRGRRRRLAPDQAARRDRLYERRRQPPRTLTQVTGTGRPTASAPRRSSRRSPTRRA